MSRLCLSHQDMAFCVVGQMSALAPSLLSETEFHLVFVVVTVVPGTTTLLSKPPLERGAALSSVLQMRKPVARKVD